MQGIEAEESSAELRAAKAAAEQALETAEEQARLSAEQAKVGAEALERAGWEMVWDPHSSKYYYHHAASGAPRRSSSFAQMRKQPAELCAVASAGRSEWSPPQLGGQPLTLSVASPSPR